MVIAKNGISIDVRREASTLVYRVLEQSKGATEILRLLGHVRDEKTGLSLRSNKNPSYNKTERRFFVRGKNKDGDNKEVVAKFGSSAEAEEAKQALERLLDLVVTPDVKAPGKGKVIIGNAELTAGGTTHVRMAFVNNSMAQELVLTGHEFYPEKVIDWEPTDPVFTNNRHYNEHIGQVVDVLNKSVSKSVKNHVLINPHRVTTEQGKQAVKMMRECFEKAQKEKFLVAWWRVVTGIRGPDFTD